jgi:hypothetical protein
VKYLTSVLSPINHTDGSRYPGYERIPTGFRLSPEWCELSNVSYAALLRQVFAPLVVLVHVVIGQGEKVAAGRGAGLAHQLHVGFLGGASGLMPVAGDTGADDVFPGVLAAAVARHDVVEGQLAALHAAVLAGVPVPVEYLVTGHFPLAVRALDHTRQADDGRQLDGLADSADVTDAVLQHLSFALEDEDDGAAGAADGERLVALVQDKDRMVDHWRKYFRYEAVPILLQGWK